MQNRITKTLQIKKSKRADRLRDLLQLTASDSILLDACARKPFEEGKKKKKKVLNKGIYIYFLFFSQGNNRSFTRNQSRYDTR